MCREISKRRKWARGEGKVRRLIGPDSSGWGLCRSFLVLTCPWEMPYWIHSDSQGSFQFPSLGLSVCGGGGVGLELGLGMVSVVSWKSFFWKFPALVLVQLSVLQCWLSSPPYGNNHKSLCFP